MKNNKKKYSFTLETGIMRAVEVYAKENNITLDEAIMNCLNQYFVNMDEDGRDPLFPQIVEYIFQFDYMSASQLQRKFSIPYYRAAKILDQLAQAGYVTEPVGAKPARIIKNN